jgi:hypothetical protein
MNKLKVRQDFQFTAHAAILCRKAHCSGTVTKVSQEQQHNKCVTSTCNFYTLAATTKRRTYIKRLPQRAQQRNAQLGMEMAWEKMATHEICHTAAF